jgi:hypothetical protein
MPLPGDHRSFDRPYEVSLEMVEEMKGEEKGEYH